MTSSAIVGRNEESGSYFDQTLTVLLIMKIYCDLGYIEYIVTTLKSTGVVKVTALNIIKITDVVSWTA